MFIWIALDDSKELKEIRQICKKENASLLLNEVTFLLPLHISLKISFKINNIEYKKIIKTIKKYMLNHNSITLTNPKIELFNSILWITYDHNETLEKIHNDLDNILKEEFNIPQHMFDKKFMFHSSLFIDENIDKLMQMYNKIKDVSLPDSITINDFIIGSSPSGENGTYIVNEVISLSKKPD